MHLLLNNNFNGIPTKVSNSKDFVVVYFYWLLFFSHSPQHKSSSRGNCKKRASSMSNSYDNQVGGALTLQPAHFSPLSVQTTQTDASRISGKGYALI